MVKESKFLGEICL